MPSRLIRPSSFCLNPFFSNQVCAFYYWVNLIVNRPKSFLLSRFLCSNIITNQRHCPSVLDRIKDRLVEGESNLYFQLFWCWDPTEIHFSNRITLFRSCTKYNFCVKQLWQLLQFRSRFVSCTQFTLFNLLTQHLSYAAEYCVPFNWTFSV